MHDHENVREKEHPRLVARNTRLGLRLFFIYLLLYGGFIGASTFAPSVMKLRALGGINLSVLCGFGLILAALILAVVYLICCRRPLSGGGAEG